MISQQGIYKLGDFGLLANLKEVFILYLFVCTFTTLFCSLLD